jgi:DNA-directed RNA polymerase specialized sigma24 family protein
MNDISLKILEKLNLLVKLTALNIVKDKDFKERVELLSSVGFKPKEMADLLGTTPNSVRVTLSRIRKGKE